MNRTLALVATTLVLAGCLGGESNSLSASPSPEAADETAPPTTAAAPPSAGVDTGALKVSVTDPEVRPVEGADVALSDTEYTTFTDAAGVATFSDLAPGPYTVLVAKPGYEAENAQGRVVEVVAGEVAEVQMVLNPIEVISVNNSYYKVWPFRAFISCAIEGQPGFLLGRTTPCGQYVTVQGVQPGDPNHKSRFTWTVDSLQVSGIVIDAKWAPATGVTAQQLRLVVNHALTCAATCIWNDATLTVGGPSPLRGEKLEGPDHKLTKKWGEDPKAYPKNLYYEVGSYCQTNCTGAQLVLQQNVDLWLTAFYGADPPVGYSATPK